MDPSIFRHQSLFAIFVLGASMLSCNKSRPVEQARTKDIVAPSSERVLRKPSEYNRVRFEVPLAQDRWTNELFPLFEDPSKSGTVEISEGIAFRFERDPSNATQRILSLNLVPADPTNLKSIKYARAPTGIEYGRLFARSVSEAFSTIKTRFLIVNRLISEASSGVVPAANLPWEIGYESDSPAGGRIKMSVRFNGTATFLAVDAATQEDALSEERFGEQERLGKALETVHYDIPLVDSVNPFAGGFADVIFTGDPNHAAILNFVRNPTHSWYDLTIGVKIPNKLAEVKVDLRTRDGKTTPIIRAPGSFQATFNWLAALDKFNDLEEKKGLAFRMDYFYSDPDGTGTANITTKTIDGRTRVYHVTTTTPKELSDVVHERIAYRIGEDFPITSKDVRGDANRCAGETCGHLSLRFRSSPETRALLSKPVRIIGAVVRATREVPLPELSSYLRLNGSGRAESVPLDLMQLSAPIEITQPLVPGNYRGFFFADLDGDGWYKDGEPFGVNLLPWKVGPGEKASGEIAIGLIK